MFYIGICDDNPGFMDIFKKTVENSLGKAAFPKQRIELVTFDKADGVLSFIESQPLALLFLDIDMPGTNGFELAKILCGSNNAPLIVFVSAYDNFVYESFDYSPFAYLRKGSIEHDLQRIVKRVSEKLFAPVKYITLSASEGDVDVAVKDILYFESQRNYYLVCMAGGVTYQCRGTMNDAEQKVKDCSFFRTHAAFLLNLSHAGRLTEDGCVCVDNYKVPISRNRIREYKKAFSEYVREGAGL